MLALFSLCFALMLAFVVGVKCGQAWDVALKARRERDPEAEAFIARLRAGVRQS